MNNISYMNNLSDQMIMQEIGRFIAHRRILLGWTQEELSEKVAISRSTLSLAERGGNISLFILIKILRILDALYVLSAFRAEEVISPLEQAKKERKERKRASSKTIKSKEEDIGW